jgi:hypothetical protein
MLRAICVFALVTGCALRVEAQPSRPELVERAGEYVSRHLLPLPPLPGGRPTDGVSER